MFPNLRAEIARKGWTNAELAKRMNVTPGTMSMKLSGKSVLTLEEAKRLKEITGSTDSLETLFATSEEV